MLAAAVELGGRNVRGPTGKIERFCVVLNATRGATKRGVAWAAERNPVRKSDIAVWRCKFEVVVVGVVGNLKVP